MPTEVKQRKKPQKQSEEVSETSPANGKTEAGNNTGANKTRFDVRSILCLLSLAACGGLSWMVLQQNNRFTEIEEKFKFLHGKTSNLFSMEEEVHKVYKKCKKRIVDELKNVFKRCRSMQPMLESLGSQQKALQPQLEAHELDVKQLKALIYGLTDKRAQLQGSLTALRDAVGQIEERTSVIAKDFANKVASVRTDVRRMDGPKSELESLLAHQGELEEKVAQVEHSMTKRIGEVLATSIDRVSNLRSASERNSQAIEQLRKRVPELTAADNQISERLRELESGRARMIRTVNYANDLKPNVAAIKRDFGAFEPQLSDLILRIGRLAEELTKREKDIAELRETFANLTAVEGDISLATKQVSEIGDISDIGEMHKSI